jgi:hypothetical protein
VVVLAGEVEHGLPGTEPPAPRERTVVLGYLLGVYAGIGFYLLCRAVWFWHIPSVPGDLVNLLIGFVVFCFFWAWLPFIVPFLVARRIMRGLGIETAGQCAALGAMTALLSLPIFGTAAHVLNVERDPGTLAIDVIGTFAGSWCSAAIAGVAAGLLYWTVEFSAVPTFVAGRWRSAGAAFRGTHDTRNRCGGP